MPLHRASVTDRRRPGARLIRTWALASIAYVAAAGALSVAPVREVMTQAARPAPLAPTLPASWKGPLPDAPDSPAVKVAKVVARQAVIAFAPPFLVLWFGWDVWFAARGFLAPDRKAPRE
ncbi:MAG: hypothetical protein ACHP9T_13705 [Caulobacterales bacterium]